MIKLSKDEALAELALEEARLEAFSGCVMCMLAHDASSGTRIAENEHGIVALDGFAATRGHLLVVARQHLEHGPSLDWRTYERLQRLVWESTQAIERVLRPSRVYVAALGSAVKLPTSFPHFHIHVVPVYETGEAARPANVLSWSSGVIRYDTNEAARLVEELRAAWPEAPTQKQDRQGPSGAHRCGGSSGPEARG